MSTVTPSSCLLYKKQKSGCQDIEETWEWGWDATKFMRKRPGDSIANVDWDVPPELSAGSKVEAGNTFYIPITNSTGVIDVPYPLIATMTTAGGAIARLRIDITLQDITA